MARDYAEDDNNDMTYRFSGQVEAYDEILELIAEPPAVYHSPPQEYCDDLNCPCTLPSLRPSSGCPERGCTHCTPGNPAPCDGCQRAEMEDAEEELAPEVLRDMLLLAGITIPVAVIIADWTPDQRREAATWAAAEHLNASDNDVERLPRPSFLPAGI
jgi:hypothetical protein